MIIQRWASEMKHNSITNTLELRFFASALTVSDKSINQSIQTINQSVIKNSVHLVGCDMYSEWSSYGRTCAAKDVIGNWFEQIYIFMNMHGEKSFVFEGELYDFLLQEKFDGLLVKRPTVYPMQCIICCALSCCGCNIQCGAVIRRTFFSRTSQ